MRPKWTASRAKAHSVLKKNVHCSIEYPDFGVSEPVRPWRGAGLVPDPPRSRHSGRRGQSPAPPIPSPAAPRPLRAPPPCSWARRLQTATTRRAPTPSSRCGTRCTPAAGSSPPAPRRSRFCGWWTNSISPRTPRRTPPPPADGRSRRDTAARPSSAARQKWPSASPPRRIWTCACRRWRFRACTFCGAPRCASRRRGSSQGGGGGTSSAWAWGGSCCGGSGSGGSSWLPWRAIGSRLSGGSGRT
ncbi:hypothetical protein DFJ74DRAFT_662911 [Hyaloraphidium curvatum]|nr:hypothetical protein DFJ74DRAFT_662911 [Hyaloraphidium curvatum]